MHIPLYNTDFWGGDGETMLSIIPVLISDWWTHFSLVNANSSPSHQMQKKNLIFFFKENLPYSPSHPPPAEPHPSWMRKPTVDKKNAKIRRSDPTIIYGENMDPRFYLMEKIVLMCTCGDKFAARTAFRWTTPGVHLKLQILQEYQKLLAITQSFPVVAFNYRL